jgi:PAS domain S-box-containing protein
MFAFVSGVLSILSWSPWMVESVRLDPFGVQPVYGPLHPLLAPYTVAWFVYVLLLFLKKYQKAEGLQELHIRYLCLALTIPFALATTTNLLVPLFWKTSALSKYGPLFSFLMLATIGHAIIRHRLMDIRVVIKRGAVYAAAVLTSAGGFALLLIASNVVLPDEHDFSLREIVLALVVAICFFPVKARVQQLFDHYLYRDPYDYQRTLREASGALTRTIELPTLLAHVGGVVTSTLKSEGVGIYLRELEGREFGLAWSAADGTLPASVPAFTPILAFASGSRRLIFRDELGARDVDQSRSAVIAELDRLGRAEVVAPLLEAGETIGLVVLGPKRSGDPYFSDDADLLTTLANQSAVAIRNAQTHARVVQVNEELQKVLGTIDSGVVAVGPTGQVSLFNRAAERFTGVPADAARGRPAGQLPVPLAGALEATASDGQPRSEIEFALPDAAGQIVPLIYSTSPLLGPRGQPLGAVAVISDLSRVKELEHERRRAERLASIEAIASGLVHEIRNPLVGIKTFSQLLPSRGVEAGFRESFSKAVAREIGRIDDLLTRFRTLSAASRQSMELLDITEPLGHALELMRPQLEQRYIRLRQVAAGVPRPVLGNASQLEQLFLNLCLNAVEAMESGGELTVRVADLCEGGGTTLLVEVSDTGRGIPEHLLESIFDPFVTTKASGTGLGLAICRGIADAHHAKLVARNNTERPGSTFTLEFPIASRVEAGATA